MKQFVLRRLHEHYTIFAEQLNCRYVLVDCLEKEGIIIDEEKRNIMTAGDDVASKTYEDIPESCWPQMRDSEQMLKSNKQLFKCLLGRNYSQISKFLKLMNDLCLTHILNYFINSEGSPSFEDVWPLPYAKRINIIECGTVMLTKMNILALSGGGEQKETNGEEIRTSLGSSSISLPKDRSISKKISLDSNNCLKLENELSNPSDSDIIVDGTLNQFGSHVGQNLINLLYNEGCISLLHKQNIEQQPTQQQQNLVMLQLIKNGSIRTFNVVLYYFLATNQLYVYNMLNNNYIGEEYKSKKWIDPKSEKYVPIEGYGCAAAWLEDQIFVISLTSNIIQVFQESKSSNWSEVGHIEMNEIADPRDMVASQLSRSVFISDSGERCLWAIQMPGKEISRWEVDGEPKEMSISQSDMLVVCVVRGDRLYLNLYRSSDVMLVESILLPTELENLNHAVQLLSGNFIICYPTNELSIFRISELSSDGRTIIRSIDPRSFHVNPKQYWSYLYLSMDEDENIFIADFENDNVDLLNSQWTYIQNLILRYQHTIESPRRLCYVREKQQLIVCQKGQGVRVVNLRLHSPQHIHHQKVESELELIKSGLFVTIHVNSDMNTRWNPVENMPDLQLIKRFKVAKESSVGGVTWLENKIYVVCRKSNKVHVFQDQEPFDEVEEERIQIEGMADPWDISASQVSRTIFISDNDNRCLWKVHVPDGTLSRWEMDGRPETLSITPSDELLVVVDREDHHDLIIFGCLDVNRSESIQLPSDVKKIAHAVQSTNGNILMSYSTEDSPDVFLISELSSNGRNFIRTYDHRFGIWKRNWQPGHLSLNVDGNVFVADLRQKRIYMMNAQLTDLQILLKAYKQCQEQFSPWRLCYAQEKQELIIGQGIIDEAGYVSVFSLGHSLWGT